MRTRHRLRVVSTCIASLLVLPAPAAAQQPPDECAPPADSAGVLRNPHGGLLPLFLMFVVAPSALLVMDTDLGCGHLRWRRVLRSQVGVYGTGGVAVTGDWHGGVARSGGVELLLRGVYAEGRVDRYGISGDARMWDVRAGYLIEPVAGIAGGVTVGYRQVHDAPDEWTQGGVLIGFPIILAACSDRHPCLLQWEPTYLINDTTLAVSPRVRFDLPVPRTPLVARLEFESRGVRHRDPMALSIGVGLRP